MSRSFLKQFRFRGPKHRNRKIRLKINLKAERKESKSKRKKRKKRKLMRTIYSEMKMKKTKQLLRLL